jgi:hypothetical protein
MSDNRISVSPSGVPKPRSRAYFSIFVLQLFYEYSSLKIAEFALITYFNFFFQSIQSSNNKSGVALNSLLFMVSEMGERLTHLYLSDNKLVGIPQLIAALAVSEFAITAEDIEKCTRWNLNCSEFFRLIVRIWNC